jgi:hypothetical protein
MSQPPTENHLTLANLKSRLDTRLNVCLCNMKPGHDDSIVGFNEAWNIMSAVFEDEARFLQILATAGLCIHDNAVVDDKA